MDVKEIITHLNNFQDTWKGWNKFLGGLVNFFRDNPVRSLLEPFVKFDDPVVGKDKEGKDITAPVGAPKKDGDKLVPSDGIAQLSSAFKK